MRTVIAATALGILSGTAAGFVAGRMWNKDAEGVSFPPPASTAEANPSPAPALPPDTPAAENIADEVATSSAGNPRVTAAESVRRLAAIQSFAKRALEAEQLFAGLSAAEIPEMFQALCELPSARMRGHLLGALCLRWGEVDGPTAFAAVATLPNRERWVASQVFEGWAKVDARGAWQAAREHAIDNPAAAYRFNGVLRELSRIDLAVAMREVATLPGRGRYPGRFSIVEAASEDGRLDAVLQAAMQLDEPEEKEAWLQGIFHRWGATETDAPMAAMRSIEDPVLAQKAMAGFMTGWSELDPRGAIEFALDHMQDPLVQNSLATVLGNAVHSMPGTEIQAIVNGARERGALATLAPKMVMPLAMFQPELAAELALEVADPRQRTQLISNTVVQWAHNDFPAAAEFYDELPDATARRDAFGGIASAALQRVNGAPMIARWLSGFSGDDRVKAATGLVNTLEWSRNNPQARPLNAESAAELAAAITSTPDLPADVLARARAVLPGSNAP